MSGINSGHHNLPTYEIGLKSENVEMCGIVAAILKMTTGFFNVGNQFRTSLSTNISNFDDIGQYWIFVVLWWPFWKWRTVEIVQCRESIRDIIIYPHIKLWWYRAMLNFCDTFWKWRPVEIFQCRDSIRDIIIYPHIKLWWYRTMLNFENDQ